MPTIANSVSMISTTRRMTPSRCRERVWCVTYMALLPRNGPVCLAGVANQLQILNDRHLPALLRLDVPDANLHLHCADVDGLARRAVCVSWNLGRIRRSCCSRAGSPVRIVIHGILPVGPGVEDASAAEVPVRRAADEGRQVG